MTETLSPRRAAYVGSFDPPTLGHIDIIRRGAAIFDRLVVGIGVNPDKQPLFSPAERQRLLEEILADVSNVDVALFTGLAVDFVRENDAAVMLRGVRTVTDLEPEFTMSLANRVLAPEIESVFLMSSDQYSHISSTLIKQIAGMAGHRADDKLAEFVPQQVIQPLIDKYDAAE